MLGLALTHRSFSYEAGGIPTNERLEFLGDSVLGLVVTDETQTLETDADPNLGLNKALDTYRKLIETIAKNTKMSTKTITRCIEKLNKNEGIQFTTIYDPKKIKKFIPYAIITWIDSNASCDCFC